MEKGLNSRIELKPSKKATKPKEADTKTQSFELYQQGKTIPEIAAIRGFTTSTIEGHLAFFIRQKKISIDALMDSKKIPAIQEAIEQIGGNKMWPVKEALGANFSYGEIKYVLAHLDRDVLKEPEVEYELVTV